MKLKIQAIGTNEELKEFSKYIKKIKVKGVKVIFKRENGKQRKDNE